MQRLCAGVVVMMAATVQMGCAERLNPELVRQFLDEPQGQVSPDSMTRVTRDLFRTDSATAAEGFAQFLKLNQGGGGTSNALPISTGVLEDAGDVFCVGGLVAGIATFDACERGQSCDAELTIDSCLLRVSDSGDEQARGKIKLQLKNSVEDNADVSLLGIKFEGWEHSQNSTHLDTFEGQIQLEVVDARDENNVEVVFASDVDYHKKRKERGWFDDGIDEHTELVAGLRFQAESTDISGRGSLEVLAFVDEDGERQQSIAIEFEAEGYRVSASEAVARASLEVRGSNGTFICTWSGSERSADRDGLVVESSGECIDDEGDVFSFEGRARDRS